MSIEKKKVEVCMSPAIFDSQKQTDDIVVVVDVLRATTSICTAFANGALRLIPVDSVDKTKKYKEQGFVVAAERNGIRLDFADMGNSPDGFAPEVVGGKEIAYSTTNGTKTIMAAADCKAVVVGAFSNISCLSEWLLAQGSNVMILCAGWKNRCNIEDTVFAGALVERLLESGEYDTICDSAKMAQMLWKANKNDLMALMVQTAQKGRLKASGQDYCIEYCATLDTTNVLPILKENYLINALK